MHKITVPSIRETFPYAVKTILTSIPLKDGTQLSATLWMPFLSPPEEDSSSPPPAPRRRYPSVLEYIPYRKSDGTSVRDSKRHPYFAGHGIVSIRVDLRGSGDSEGFFVDEYLEQELADAEEVISWMANQSWSNGSVGMFGKSWGAFNSLMLAARAPPQLKAVMAVAGTVDRYQEDVHYLGGCVEAYGMLSWAAVMLAYNTAPPDPMGITGKAWKENWLLRLRHTPPFVHAWLSHPNRDTYWLHGSVCETYEKIKIPILAVGGLADGYTAFVPRLLESLPEGQVYGVLGPWAHQYPEDAFPGPPLPFAEECVAWWQQWLLGTSERNASESYVKSFPSFRGYVLDTPASPAEEHIFPAPVRQGVWHTVLHGDLRDVWYLTSSSSLTTTTLEPKEFIDDGVLVLASDATLGAKMGPWWGMGCDGQGPEDQCEDDAKALCFDTTPRAEETILCGDPVVYLRVSVDEPVAFVAVRLCAVDSSGSSLLLSYGVLSLNRKDSMAMPTPVALHTPLDIRVPLRYTSRRIPAGYRLRLALSQNWWPMLWPSPRPVTLSVYPEGCKLVLPRLSALQEYPIDTSQTEIARPIETKTLIDASYSRTVTRPSPATCCCTVVDNEGECTYPNGLTRGGTSREVYEIDAERVTSATVLCEGTVRYAREDPHWLIQTHVRTQMTCDEKNFYVETEITAMHNGEIVFEAPKETKAFPRCFH